MERMKPLPTADPVLVYHERMGKNDMIAGYCTIIIAG